jgi:hypothetical protein
MVERGDARIRSPCVVVAQQLAREAAALPDGAPDPIPDAVEVLAEEQTEAGPDEVDGGKVGALHPATCVCKRDAASAGTAARSRSIASGSASIASTDQPRASIAAVSIPAPHPRSSAAPGASNVASTVSSMSRGARPAFAS